MEIGEFEYMGEYRKIKIYHKKYQDSITSGNRVMSYDEYSKENFELAKELIRYTPDLKKLH